MQLQDFFTAFCIHVCFANDQYSNSLSKNHFLDSRPFVFLMVHIHIPVSSYVKASYLDRCFGVLAALASVMSWGPLILRWILFWLRRLALCVVAIPLFLFSWGEWGVLLFHQLAVAIWGYFPLQPSRWLGLAHLYSLILSPCVRR